jgi:hypothetical protein
MLVPTGDLDRAFRRWLSGPGNVGAFPADFPDGAGQG